jgi:Kef-type K+ transport system membrane component KefB/nucleotide-binding universal stress UspA family protein
VLTATALLFATPAFAADPPGAETAVATFIGQIVILLAVGRLLGELAQRIGQPAIMGQLIAGMLLGPSVFGNLLPDLRHVVFPDSREQKIMLDAVSQLGILLLLLVTGMETNLSVVRRVRRPAISVSIAGIVLPFICGFALGELLPDSMLPDPGKRLVTSLFLGVGLSISSVKIVAVVVREMGFLQRNVGQVIMAAAIIDDTIGWIIMSMIFGLAQHGSLDMGGLLHSFGGTVLFLVVSFTVGRRLVSSLIRWTNDNMVSEVPVITVIIVLMGLMALTTHFLGVHTVLGAFVAGMLVGQSPILTRHIDEQLRGLITALFMPVFFGIAGLSADLSILKDPSLVLLGLGLVAIASFGKFAGAFVGGTIGGMSLRESLALACGMNARGSTEVIVATIGLSMGVLSQDLFSLIVAMAVITTTAMPPMLRWALSNLPLNAAEAARLEHEEREARGFVPRLERLLVAADASSSGKLASRLAGLLIGARRTPVTIVDLAVGSPDVPDPPSAPQEGTDAIARQAAESADPPARADLVALPAQPADVTTRKPRTSPQDAVAAEARKGYDLLMVGTQDGIGADGLFGEPVAPIVTGFEGPAAIISARGPHAEDPVGYRLDILVPINGTANAGRAGEVALAIARASQASVTALFVLPESASTSRRRRASSRLALRSEEEAALKQFVELADHYDVPVATAVRTGQPPAEAILQRIRRGDHSLVVLGASRRTGEGLSFGPMVAELVARCDRSLMLIAS